MVAQPQRRARPASESRVTRPRVPRAPTHLDLTDDSADSGEPETASEFRAIEFEPAAPREPRNRAGSNGANRPVKTRQTPPAPAESRATAPSATAIAEPSHKLDP